MSVGHGGGADTKRDIAMQDWPAPCGPTNEPDAQRAQYYLGGTSGAIFNQLEPVSPQSVTLGRGELRDAADSANVSVKPQVRGGPQRNGVERARPLKGRTLSAPPAVSGMEIVGHYEVGQPGLPRAQLRPPARE